MATSPPWYLEIIQVSSHEKQQDLLTLLREVVSVTALGSSTDSEYFVIFDCPDLRLKVAIEKLFAVVDSASVLTQTHHDRSLQPEGGVSV